MHGSIAWKLKCIVNGNAWHWAIFRRSDLEELGFIVLQKYMEID